MKEKVFLMILLILLAGCKPESDAPNLKTEMVFSKANGEVTQEFETGETIHYEIYITNRNKLETAIVTYYNCDLFDIAVKSDGEEALWTEEDLMYGCSGWKDETIIYPQERLKVFDGKLEYWDDSNGSYQNLLLNPGTYHVDLELTAGYGGFSTKQLTILPAATGQ